MEGMEMDDGGPTFVSVGGKGEPELFDPGGGGGVCGVVDGGIGDLEEVDAFGQVVEYCYVVLLPLPVGMWMIMLRLLVWLSVPLLVIP